MSEITIAPYSILCKGAKKEEYLDLMGGNSVNLDYIILEALEDLKSGYKVNEVSKTITSVDTTQRIEEDDYSWIYGVVNHGKFGTTYSLIDKTKVTEVGAEGIKEKVSKNHALVASRLYCFGLKKNSMVGGLAIVNVGKSACLTPIKKRVQEKFLTKYPGREKRIIIDEVSIESVHKKWVSQMEGLEITGFYYPKGDAATELLKLARIRVKDGKIPKRPAKVSTLPVRLSISPGKNMRFELPLNWNTRAGSIYTTIGSAAEKLNLTDPRRVEVTGMVGSKKRTFVVGSIDSHMTHLDITDLAKSSDEDNNFIVNIALQEAKSILLEHVFKAHLA